MKIYETPIINVKKFHEECIVTSSGEAVKAVRGSIGNAIPNGNEVKSVAVLEWAY